MFVFVWIIWIQTNHLVWHWFHPHFNCILRSSSLSFMVWKQKQKTWLISIWMLWSLIANLRFKQKKYANIYTLFFFMTPKCVNRMDEWMKKNDQNNRNWLQFFFHRLHFIVISNYMNNKQAIIIISNNINGHTKKKWNENRMQRKIKHQDEPKTFVLFCFVNFGFGSKKKFFFFS